MADDSNDVADMQETPRRHPSRLRQVLIMFAWLLPALLISILAYLQLSSSRGVTGSFSVANYQAEAEVVATPAPDFQLPDLAGAGDRSLSALRGHVVVLNFWASWCTPCRQEAPDIEKTWESYRGSGVQFLGVNERDNNGAALAFVDEFQLSYPSVTDPAGQLAGPYRLFGMPTTVIIDPSGQMVYRFTGILSGPVLRSALDDVLSRGSA